MTWKEAFDFGIYHIQDHYQKREAEQVMAILFEDCFAVTNRQKVTELTEGQKAQFHTFVQRLKNGEPIQYVTGVANFMGINLKVSKRVLIPRPETEELVAWILEDYAQSRQQLDVMDIGTGSGCIPIAIKKKKPSFRVFALEESLDALNVARINAKNLKTHIEIFRIDFLDEQDWTFLGSFDIIVSNPPYIPKKEEQLMHKNVLDFEPYEALFVEDEEPLLFYKKLSKFADLKLKENGACYMEINEHYSNELQQYLLTEGWVNIEVRKDMQGKDRMIKISR